MSFRNGSPSGKLCVWEASTKYFFLSFLSGQTLTYCSLLYIRFSTASSRSCPARRHDAGHSTTEILPSVYLCALHTLATRIHVPCIPLTYTYCPALSVNPSKCFRKLCHLFSKSNAHPLIPFQILYVRTLLHMPFRKKRVILFRILATNSRQLVLDTRISTIRTSHASQCLPQPVPARS
jgi:hypothetical protein